jgi:hypothetical protein
MGYGDYRIPAVSLSGNGNRRDAGLRLRRLPLAAIAKLDRIDREDYERRRLFPRSRQLPKPCNLPEANSRGFAIVWIDAHVNAPFVRDLVSRIRSKHDPKVNGVDRLRPFVAERDRLKAKLFRTQDRIDYDWRLQIRA